MARDASSTSPQKRNQCEPFSHLKQTIRTLQQTGSSSSSSHHHVMRWANTLRSIPSSCLLKFTKRTPFHCFTRESNAYWWHDEMKNEQSSHVRTSSISDEEETKPMYHSTRAFSTIIMNILWETSMVNIPLESSIPFQPSMQRMLRSSSSQTPQLRCVC